MAEPSDSFMNMTTRAKRSRSLDENDYSENNEYDGKDLFPNRIIRNKRNKLRIVQSQIDGEISRTIDSNENATTTVNNRDEPVGESCVFCAKFCDSTSAIQCDICTQYYHVGCCGLDGDHVLTILNIVKVLGWTCRACRSDARKTTESLKIEISNIKLEIKRLTNSASRAIGDRTVLSNGGATEKISGFLHSDVTSYADVATTSLLDDFPSLVPPSAIQDVQSNRNLLRRVEETVRKTVVDASKRRSNVIVSGLIESSTITDADSFSDLCEYYLGIKPSLVHPYTRRLGREGGNEHPRRLLVNLRSEIDARELLRNAKFLRESEDEYVANSIYINADLSKEEAKAAYERRRHRREIRPTSSIINNGDQHGRARTTRVQTSRENSIDHQQRTFVNRSWVKKNITQPGVISSNLIVCSENVQTSSTVSSENAQLSSQAETSTTLNPLAEIFHQPPAISA